MSMRIGGLASGMDIDSIVEKLMTAERIPLDKLEQQKNWTEWQQEAYRDFNLSLSELQTSADKIRFQSNFNSYSATSYNESVVNATTQSNAMAGTYKVIVGNLASSARMYSAKAIENGEKTPAKSTDQIGLNGNGYISIKANKKDPDGNDIVIAEKIEITTDMTFKKIAQTIQDATAGKDIELRVNFDDATSRFFISTKGMGDDQNFKIEFSSKELAEKVMGGLTEDISLDTYTYSTDDSDYARLATNAKINFDGIELVGLTSNEISINGLTLNLVQKGDSTVTVQSNPSKTIEAIKEFVGNYNKVIDEIENKLVEKRYRDFPPLTKEQRESMEEKEIELWEEKAKSGLLRNDSILQSALYDLRRALTDPVEGIANGNINLLSQIGINTGDYSEGGKLTIDEDKLSTALSEKPDEVMQLFTNSEGGLGIGKRVYQELGEVLKTLSDRAGNPKYSVDNSTISKRIREMDEEISSWQDRLLKIENRYWRQFSAMEKAINQMNQQSMMMQQSMFGGM